MTLAPNNTCLLILGPTASGKSGLAVGLAKRLDGVVINADSRQLYADLRILTARPSVADEAEAPHDLYGVLGGADIASAMWWREQAVAAMQRAKADGRLPILTGGTGFYIRALLYGLPDMPDVGDDLRQAINDEMASRGAPAMHAVLADCDPVLAAGLRPSDTQRIARGLAVFRASGIPLSDWQARPLPGPPPGWAFKTVILEPDRADLYRNCDQRLVAMFDDGALAEVEQLLALRLPPTAPVLQSVGVPEITAYLAGETDISTALTLAQADTRHYAKRQQTWFRHQLPDIAALRLNQPSVEAVLDWLRSQGA